jgi:hypothetical protein
MRDAFGSATTTKLLLYRCFSGYWDGNNQWRSEGYEAGIKIYGTPIPVGERQTGTHGENLTPDKTGERLPASMKFTSRTEMNINDVIYHEDIPYKISRKGDYSPAGFWSSVGVTLRRFELTPEGKVIIEEM